MMYSKADDIESFMSGKQVVKVSMPTVSTKREFDDTEDNCVLVAHSKTKNPDLYESLNGDSYSVQITPELVTLAMLPKTQWQSLVNLDIMKVIPILLTGLLV